MYNYKYLAKTIDGHQAQGTLEAENRTDFFMQLKQQGLFCINFSENKGTSHTKDFRKLKTKELIVFCRKLGTMIHSGLSITNALEVLYQTAEKQYLKDLFLGIFERIQTGLSLSEALKSYGRAFSRFFISMIESGEESGALDKVLLELSTHYEKENMLHAKVKAATVYPIILSSMSLVVIIVLFTFVLPNLFKIFDHTDLPAITRVMMAISRFFVNYWFFILAGILLLITFFASSDHIPGVNMVIAKLKVKAPVIGRFNLMVYQARFARSMSLLFSSGVTLLSTLGISCNVLNNVYITDRFTHAVDLVMGGSPLSEAIDSQKIFDSMFVSMIKVGEESGNMEQILKHTADYYDVEADVAVQRLVSTLEPVLLVTLGVIILFILIAVMVPIYSMYQGIQ